MKYWAMVRSPPTEMSSQLWTEPSASRRSVAASNRPVRAPSAAAMRDGATPVLNAVSVFLMVASAAIALLLMRGGAQGRR